MAKNEEPLDCATSVQIENLLTILNQEKKALARNHLYKEATNCANMINYVSKYHDAAKKREIQAIAKTDFSPIKKEHEETLNKFDEETQMLEEELIQSLKSKREAFEASQQEELDEFEARWNSEEKLRIYNKGTSKLNLMKTRIPYLLIDNRFEEAELTQKDIEIKTEEEVFEHHFVMQSDYDRSLRHLLKKQDQDLQAFNVKCEVELNIFRQNRNKIRQGYLNRQVKLKFQEDTINNPDKLWVHWQNKMIKSNDTNSQLSPPSKMKISDFRQTNVASLVLPPLKNRLNHSKRSRRPLSTK